MSIKITGLQEVQEALKKEMQKISGGGFALVGVHEAAGNVEDSTFTLAKLGATLHYGAKINHPGGTTYGYATQADAKKGAVRFLKKGAGFMALGTTGPHQITIPPRPFLDNGVESGNKEYIATIQEGIQKGLEVKKILDQVGTIAVGYVQQKMIDVKSPPNAASTIKKKGSSNPLINNGTLSQSITHSIANKKPEESL